MDTFFISHGAVTLVSDETAPPWLFMKSWKSDIMEEAPKAILIVSGHWDTDAPTVNLFHGAIDTIHDFTGVPEFFYKLKYPAPGAPDLTKRVTKLLDESGFGPVQQDETHGLDHGAWVPLMLMYPEANIPVCQLSIQTAKGAGYHYNLGKTLSPLREEGVLIIGTGNITHNLDALGPMDAPIPNWALDFDTWVKDALLDGRYDDVNNYEKGPYAKMNQPNPDHFFPLHVALGAAGHGAKAELIHHSWSNGVISYASYRFTAAR